VTLVAAVLLGGLVTAGPAAAHDRLVGSEPSEAAVLEQAPTSVVLTFSAEQLPVGAAVVVSDAAGVDHADGAPVVDGATVTQPLRADLPAGAYTVRWRSVSGDGHPVEGTFGFEVTGDTASERDVVGPAPADPTASPVPDAADGADDADAPMADDDAASGAADGTTAGGGAGDDGGAAPVLAGAGLAAAAAAATAVLVLRRRRGAGEGTAP
jgi:methionine-rich copper-binding protein CopC